MKINLPEEFSGDRNKYDEFRTQLALSFAANPSRFEDEKAKIVFAASFLRGPAADWEFMKALRAVFDDPDTVTTFAYDLQRLRQGKKTVSEYYAKFLTLSKRLNRIRIRGNYYHYPQNYGDYG